MDLPLEQFLTWLSSTNHSPATVRNHQTGLRRFGRWCAGHGIDEPGGLTPDLIEGYRLALFRATGRGDSPLSWATQGEYLGVVKGFLRWCHNQGRTSGDVAAGLVLPRRPYALPLNVLSARETERVLRQAKPTTAIGLRDRAMLELFYSTGLRRAEVAHLRVGDVDVSRGVVLVRQGKGQRDRVTPIGRRAIRWVQRYLRQGRPRLVGAVDSGVLFLTTRGRGFGLNRLSERVSRYFTLAGFPGRGSCHLFRHTAATLLLEGGADVREVQEILGHRNLTTTARYTHISIARLQAVHARAHPAEAREGRVAGRRRRGRF
jgi:integrase/recombinase XerD